MIELRVFLPGNSLVRELDLRGSKMGGFEVAKLYVLGLWPVAANCISSAETSGSAANDSLLLKMLEGQRRMKKYLSFQC